MIFFFFTQEPAYEMGLGLEFRRVLFRSVNGGGVQLKMTAVLAMPTRVTTTPNAYKVATVYGVGVQLKMTAVFAMPTRVTTTPHADRVTVV